MSTPPRWTKEEPKPELRSLRMWSREDNGHNLEITMRLRRFWWWIDKGDIGNEPTLHAAKCAATRALKRITKRSE